MQGLSVSAYGDPARFVTLVDVPELDPPRPGEVILEVEASPVDPTDLYIIADVYGELPPLPHLLGCEGVGRVVAVGPWCRSSQAGRPYDRSAVEQCLGGAVARSFSIPMVYPDAA